MSNIRFLKFKVVNDKLKTSAKVHYSLDNRTDGRKCVTIYAKEYGHQLSKVFVDDAVINDTDTMTDYFCKDTIRLFEDHPLYAVARKHVNEMNGDFEGEPKQIEVTDSDLIVADTYINLLSRLGVKQISVQ